MGGVCVVCVVCGVGDVKWVSRWVELDIDFRGLCGRTAVLSIDLAGSPSYFFAWSWIPDLLFRRTTAKEVRSPWVSVGGLLAWRVCVCVWQYRQSTGW